MDVNEAVVWPRSAREYTAQVIDAAVHAPNALNQRPWASTVVARTRF
jgi:nitroreductase